jgi:hypothetical protein
MNMDFSQEIIEQIRELHESAKIEAQQLKKTAEEAAATERLWARCREYVTKGWTLHFMALTEEESGRLKQMRSEANPIVPQFEAAYRAAKDDSDKVFRRYPAALEQASTASGLAPDANSRHPKYTFESGFFRLEIDEKKRLARLSDYEGRLAELPADVEAVVEALKREHKRVFGRKYNGAKFLQSLRNQYKAVIKKEKMADGSPVPIRHITRRLGKNVKGFRTDEFLLDLSRLTEKGPYEVDGRRLDLQQTKDTNQGMLLHGASSRGYIGFVVFKEV